MKRFLIVLALFCVVAMLCAVGDTTVNRKTEALSAPLDQIDQLAAVEQYQEALVLCEELQQAYEQDFPFFCALLHHQRLEEIERSLCDLHSSLFLEQREEARAACAQVELLLRELAELDRLGVGNLF